MKMDHSEIGSKTVNWIQLPKRSVELLVLGTC